MDQHYSLHLLILYQSRKVHAIVLFIWSQDFSPYLPVLFSLQAPAQNGYFAPYPAVVWRLCHRVIPLLTGIAGFGDILIK
jgi:hypothetical protein